MVVVNEQEKVEDFGKTAEQREVLESLPENFIDEIRTRAELKPGEEKRAKLAGAVFEILAEQQHKIELAKENESVERSELASELLDFLKYKAGKTLRRPDAIDLRESEQDGKIEIVRMVEATAGMLGKRKYFQLRDFEADFSNFLKGAKSNSSEVRGYENLSKELNRISISKDMKTAVYISADKDLGNIHTFVDGSGLNYDEWEEFEEIIRDCDIRKSVFSSRDIGRIVDRILPYF